MNKQTLLRAFLFLSIVICLFITLIQYLGKEKQSEAVQDSPLKSSVRPCLSNLEGTHWKIGSNLDSLNYSFRFVLRRNKRVRGSSYPPESTWEIRGDTLFIGTNENKNKFILEGCPPKFTILVFDSLYNDYIRTQAYALH